MSSEIYCILNASNGHRYIGQSVDLSRRKSYHFTALRKEIHRNKHLQPAWNRYGDCLAGVLWSHVAIQSIRISFTFYQNTPIHHQKPPGCPTIDSCAEAEPKCLPVKLAAPRAFKPYSWASCRIVGVGDVAALEIWWSFVKILTECRGHAIDTSTLPPPGKRAGHTPHLTLSRVLLCLLRVCFDPYDNIFTHYACVNNSCFIYIVG